MFQRWGFLLGEIWVLLLLAALLGVLVGWLIWGRRNTATIDTAEADGLRASLDACTAKGRDQGARIATLEADLAKSKAAAAEAETAAASAMAASAATAAAANATASAPAPSPAAPLMSAPAVVKAEAPPKAKAEAKPKAKAEANAKPVAIAKPAAKAAEKTTAAPEPKAKAKAKADDKAPAKPKGLDKARGGKADDLKMIKGIGPKLEILCHKLGFFHFDQIAEWSAKEIAWVDDNLEGFKGRVTRDEWVKQAKVLAKGGTTEFSSRVKAGDVY